MKIGVFGTLTDGGIRMDELAVAVEERGFESLWIGEHTHVPVAVASHPKEGAEPLPEFYKRLPDPFVQLGAAAAVTSKIRLGTSVVIVPEHDPIILAKKVATVDYLSDGRMEFGIGYGWNKLELKHHGVGFKERRRVFAEKLQAMKEFWYNDVAEFSGEFVNFEASYQWPKPVQKEIPLLIGAEAGPKTAHDIVHLANGWLPMAFRGGGERLPEQLKTIKETIEADGRSLSDLNLTLMDPFLAFENYTPEEFDEGQKECEGMKIAEDHGFDRLVVGIPFFDRDRALAHLDAAAKKYFG